MQCLTRGASRVQTGREHRHDALGLERAEIAERVAGGVVHSFQLCGQRSRRKPHECGQPGNARVEPVEDGRFFGSRRRAALDQVQPRG